MMATMVDYRDRLAWAMQQAEMTAASLARGLGVSRQAIGKILDGSSTALTAYNNAVAARILRVNGDWLATGEGTPAPYPEAQALDVARRFDALGATSKKLLLQRLAEIERGK